MSEDGFNLSARVFGLPVFEENGGKMLHIGLGYNHAFLNEDNLDVPMRFRTRPESRLTNNMLVDTGPISGKDRGTVNAELDS